MLTPDEIRGAAAPVCPTCRLRENQVCSNPWHFTEGEFATAMTAQQLAESFQSLFRPTLASDEADCTYQFD